MVFSGAVCMGIVAVSLYVLEYCVLCRLPPPTLHATLSNAAEHYSKCCERIMHK